MAGDWIKMRTLLPGDPRVVAMANHLALDPDFMQWLTDPVRQSCKESAYEHVTPSVTRCVTVTGLLKVWGMVMELCKRDGERDARVTHCSLFTLDEIADVPGFGAAMASVEWVVEDGNSLIFPNFLEENSSAEERKKEQARVRKQRQRTRDKERDMVRDTQRDIKRDSHAKCHAREENIREDKNLTTTPPLPPPPKPSSVPKHEQEPEYQHLPKAFFKKIELLFDNEIAFAWRGHQTRLLKDQVKRLGEETVLRVIREAAKGIGGPGVNDRATYLLRIVERYAPAVAAAQDEHWGRVKCVCGTTHKILMPIQQRKLYWSVRGKELAIKCGCGESVPTGKRVPDSYDVTELRDMPTDIEKALSV